MRRIQLRAIETPGIGHQAPAADPPAAVVGVIEIRQPEEMAGLMADHADAGDSRAAGVPKRGFGMVVIDFDLGAIGIAVLAGPVAARQGPERPAVRPDPLSAATAGLRGIARMDDVDRIDKTVVVLIELAEINQRIRQIQGVFHHPLGILGISPPDPVLAIGIVGFGIRQGDPGNHRALEIHRSIGRLGIIIPDTAGGGDRRIPAHRIEQHIVIRLGPGVHPESVIGKLAEDHQILDRTLRRHRQCRAGKPGAGGLGASQPGPGNDGSRQRGFLFFDLRGTEHHF